MRINNLYKLRDILLRNPIKAILIVSFTARIAGVLYIGINNSWAEWGTIASRLASGDGYSYYSVTASGDVISSAQEGSPLPSAYMPPGYVFFIFPFVFLFGKTSFSFFMIQITQVFLGTVSCLLLYLICKNIFDDVESSLYSSLILSFYPTYVYLASQISSANLYIFLFVLLVYLSYNFVSSRKNIILISACTVCGIAALTRAQYVVLIPIISLWIYIVLSIKSYKYALIFFVLSTFVVSTWTYRNYKVFNDFVPIAQSAGYNLWRGQTVGPKGTWKGPKSSSLKADLRRIPTNKNYESERDRIFLHEAVYIIKSNPVRSIKLSLVKLTQVWIYFWWLEWYPNTNNPLYFLPWMFLVPISVLGIFKTSVGHRYLIPVYSLPLIVTVFTAVFFALPRYRLSMVPSMVILSTPFFLKTDFQRFYDKVVKYFGKMISPY